MHPPAPLSESALFERANALAGKTLSELANTWGEILPPTLTHAKGWIGQFIERILGANAFNLDQPDFVHLGIELKTLPVSSSGHPQESTYICAISIPNRDKDFEHSRVWRKLAKVLWIPIETCNAMRSPIPLGERRVGTPLLWSPCASVKQSLQQDWEELMELITLGYFDALNAHKGKYLQIRPKAANSKTLIQVLNQDGQWVSTVPKGFYLRSNFTQKIIDEFYL